MGVMEHLDLVGGLKAVQLVEQLQHGTLHLAVTAASAVVCARTTNAVHLIHEDDAGRMLPTVKAQSLKLSYSHEVQPLSGMLIKPHDAGAAGSIKVEYTFDDTTASAPKSISLKLKEVLTNMNIYDRYILSVRTPQCMLLGQQQSTLLAKHITCCGR